VTDSHPQQIVFIDSRVPDLQDLLNGLQPGERAFVLDPSSDGIQQIANVLAANNLTDLSSIAIVSHGDSGELELGSSFITESNLAGHSNALAEIGASLAPGGAIQLYGCDVALGSAGQQFINDFSTFAGGAQVEAATHLVGSAALDGSWTLDASSDNGATAVAFGANGPLDSASGGPLPGFGQSAGGGVEAPFTQAALANFQGTLPVASPVQTEIWFVTAGGGNSNTIDFADNTGNNTATNSHTQYQGNTALSHPTDIALDTQDDLYFMVDSDGSHDVIEKGTLSQAVAGTAGPTFTTLYTEPKIDPNTFGNITALAIDVADQIIYFVQNDNNGTTASFDEIKFNGTGLKTLATVSNVFFNDMTLDLTTGNAYITAISEYVGFGGTTVGANLIYDVSGITPSATTAAIAEMPISPSDSVLLGDSFPTSLGVLEGIAVDKTNHILYFTTDATSGTTNGGIYFYDLTGNPTGTFGTVWQQPAPDSLNSTAGTPFAGLDYIEVDPATNTYYVGDFGKVTSVGVSDNSIYVGSLTGTALQRTPSHFLSIDTHTSPSTASPLGMAIDNAPTLAITPVAGPTFTESVNNPASANNTPVLVASAASVSDSDNTEMTGATVSIGGFFVGDVLGFSTAGTSIAASYHSSTGVLTLSGIDSFAHYQAVLASVTFGSTSDNPTDYNSDLSRTLTWVVNDGLLTSAPQTATVSVVGVNDPPTLAGVASSANFTEEGAAVTLSGSASVADPDNLDLVNATVSITGGTFVGDGDVLVATAIGSVTVSYDSANERLILSGSDTLAHYQSVLDSVTFSAGENPTDFGSHATRTVTWALNDGSGSFNLSTTQTTTVSITNVNDAPTLNNVATSAHFTEEGGAVTLSNAVSVTDPDNLDLAGATVSITGGAFTGDVLSATGTGSVTASYDSVNERLILSGSDTLANYQSVLDSVTFSAGENPTDFGSKPTRLVTWVLNDGSASNNLSTAATTTVSITNVNDAPTLTGVASSANFTEEGAAVTLSGSASVTDPDNLDLANATVSITGGTFVGDADVLAATAIGGVTVSYDSANERLILFGSDTLAHYQNVLDSVTFSAGENPTDFGSHATRTVTWTLNDGSGSFNLSTTQTTTVSITNVNDAPTLNNVATSAHFTEEGGAVTLSNAASVIDPDNLDLASATVSVTGGAFTGDVLAATGIGSVTASYDSVNERLILSGSDTLANYQSVLDSVTFSAGENPTDFGSDTTRTVTWVLNDGSASNSLSTAATTTVSITNVNDAPTLAGVAPIVTVTAQTTVTLSGNVTVSDPDNLKLASATVSITGGTFAGDGDILAATATGAISVSYDSANERLILSGSDTLANYQTVLDSVTFDPNVFDPSNGGLNPTRTVTWVLNDGGSSFNLSTAQTETIAVTPADFPPTLSGVAANASWTEEGAVTTLSPGISVTDPDSTQMSSATVSIAGGTFANDQDVLAAVTTGTAITASYNSSTETLILSGSDTPLDYQHVLDSVTFHAGENPTDYGSNPTRTVTWLVKDQLGVGNAPVTTTVGITSINDQPTLSNVAASASYTEAGAAVTLSGSAAVSDPDNLDLVNATVSIAGGKFANDGDVLNVSTAGTSIAASYDSTNERLILSGSDTTAHYQQVLDSLTFSTPGQNPTDYGSNPTRTVTWVLNDGSGSFNLSSVATTTVGITAINNAPTLGNVPGVDSYTESAAPVTVAPGASVSDPDNLTLTNATVSIGNGFAGDGDLLAATTAGTSITASYNSSTETLTLSGSDTLAHYQSVLDSVTFASSSHNPTNYGSNLSRVLSWTLNDGSASSNLSTAQFTTVVVTAVNDPPTLSNVAASVAVATVGQTVTVSPALAVSDSDNLKLANATVAISGGTFLGDGDLLAAVTTGTSITASYNSSTETLTLTGSDTLAHYQSVLDSITFASGPNPTNSGANPTRTLTWQVNDGSASNNLGTATTTITFQPFLRFIGTGDFDANGRSDIAWASNGGGHATLWSDSNGAFTQALIPNAAMGAEWTAVGTGDFNGDGKADILWANTAGQAAVWELSGPNLIGFGVSAGQMGPEWHVAAIGDFNGDHKSDILWVSNTGAAAVWTMNGTTLGAFAISNGAMGTEWSVLGTGDFNQDGRADVLWKNTAGTVDIWEMNGPNLSGLVQNVGTAPANSHLAGVGHFSANNPFGTRGNSDIVWVDNTNHVTIWDINNGNIASSTQLNGLDGPEWHLAAVGNFSNIPSDTNSDLLWISNSGAVNIWVVNGANVQEIPVSAPTGSTLGLTNAAQSQAQPAIQTAPAAGPLAPPPPTPPLILASTPTTPTLIGAGTGPDPQTHTLV
jgi:hypothetical protein